MNIRLFYSNESKLEMIDYAGGIYLSAPNKFQSSIDYIYSHMITQLYFKVQ